MHEHAAPVLVLKGISRHFGQGASKVEVLKNADLRLCSGEIAALVGPSGSGKSTLLHIAGLLENANSGSVQIGPETMTGASDLHRTLMRRLNIGFVYQFHHLLPELTALENIVLPSLIAAHGRRSGRKRAWELLERMGLRSRAAHYPSQLSGGERQRVAVARALANRPRLLLADEPTGSLDPDTASHVHATLLSLIRGEGLCALIATHNVQLAQNMDRIVRIDNGRLVETMDRREESGRIETSPSRPAPHREEIPNRLIDP
ncbi:MAG: ABC transporter ATP-binding protein [Hyphomicrobiales bacterium]